VFNPQNPFHNPNRNVTRLAASPRPGLGLPASVTPGDFGDPGAGPRAERGLGRRTGKFISYPFLAQVAPIIIVPEQPERFYLIIINNSAANRIFVGFGYDANAINGVILEVNLGFYEPWIIPTNAIHISAAGANTAGTLLVAVAH